MDKENNNIENNIDDVLKHLKNTYENQNDPLPDAKVVFENERSEELSSDDISERLRQAFMSGEEYSTEEKSEYEIDESIMSEFIDESQTLEEQESEPIEQAQEESPLEEDEAESLTEEISKQTVEIIIPFIESMVSESQSIEKDSSENTDEEEEYDFYEEENSENSYVCFADYEADDDEIFSEQENPADPLAEDEDVTVNEDADGLVEDDDDLPWYTDDELLSSSYSGVEEKNDIELDDPAAFETEESFEEAKEESSYEEEPALVVDEEIKEELVEEAVEENVDEALFVAEETIEGEAHELDSNVELEPQDEPKPAYSVFSENNTLHSPKRVDDGEPTSFYRTIIDARAERERLYGYSYLNNTSDDEKDDGAQALESFGESEREELEALDKTESEQILDTEFYELGDVESEQAENLVTDENEEAFVSSEPKSEQNIKQGEVYRDKKSYSLLKSAKQLAMCVLALAIFVLELMPVLGIVPDGFLDYTSYSVSYILIDAQLLIFMSALFYEKLLDGLLKLLTPFANFYSILSATVIATLISSVLSCFFTNDDAPRLYNFISAAYILALYVFECLEGKRKRESIRILENEKVFTLRRSQGSNSSAEKMYAGGVDPDKSIFEPVEIDSKDFRVAFAREKAEGNKSFANSVIISAITPITIFAVIMTVLSMVFERGLYVSFNVLSFVFVTTAPFAAMIAYYLPLLVSHLRLSKRGCVIAGYEGALAMSECDVLVFSDKHLFKDCEAKEAGIKLYCDEKTTRQLFVSLACVYSKIDGPMKNTFSSILGDEPHKVSMIRITRNGFEAVVDNQMNIIVGTSEYLGRYGIFVPKTQSEETGVIYAALNSALCAKINVFYRTQPIFEALAEILNDCNIRTVIETYDPVITGKYVAKCRGESDFPISVVHKNIKDYKAAPNQTASLGRAGAFATSSRLKLVELLSFCKGISKVRFINTCILIGSYVLSGLLCAVFVISGAIEQTNMLWVLLYQLALIGVYTFTAIKLLPLSFEGIEEKKRRAEIRKREKENRNQI